MNATRRPWARFSLRTLLGAVALFGCLCGLLAFMVPKIVAAREAARRIRCTNNFTSLSGAVRITPEDRPATQVEPR